MLTVLLVAAVGILLGLGRLAMYRDQCVRRFDRQREIERMLATRSVLRYVHGCKLGRNFKDTRTVTNTFRYKGTGGREYLLTLQPSASVLDSDLKDDWVPVCDQGAQTSIAVNERSFAFDGTGTNGSHCLIGRILPSSWTEHPWGLRYTVLPGGLSPGTDQALPETIMCMYIVGGELPEGGVGKADLANNPLIRVDNLYTHSSGADNDFANLQVHYGDRGLDTIQSHEPLADPITQARWTHMFGVQLAGDAAALFEHGSLDYTPTFSVGSLPSDASRSFKTRPRIYVGCRQTGQPTNVCYLVKSISIRPPYEWDVLITWEENLEHRTERATVIHAAGDEGSNPRIAVTYDTHGTAWQPGGR